jgi:hypothetical protein
MPTAQKSVVNRVFTLGPGQARIIFTILLPLWNIRGVVEHFLFVFSLALRVSRPTLFA